jgi:hypothetical protein
MNTSLNVASSVLHIVTAGGGVPICCFRARVLIENTKSAQCAQYLWCSRRQSEGHYVLPNDSQREPS